MTSGIVDNELKTLEAKTDLTHGEKIFLQYGISGVRGEAETGFSMIFESALNVYDYNSYPSQNHRLTNTLLHIMSSCEDTTILHRHNYDVLLELQKKSKKIIELGGVHKSCSIKEIEDLNHFNENNNISPGGCADLLSLTVFFSKVKEFFY